MASQKGTLCSPQLCTAGVAARHLPVSSSRKQLARSLGTRRAALAPTPLWCCWVSQLHPALVCGPILHPRSCRKGASPWGTLQGDAHRCGQAVLRTPKLGLEVGNSFLPAPQHSSADLHEHVIGSLYLLILAIKQSSSVRNPVRAFDSCSCDSQQL